MWLCVCVRDRVVCDKTACVVTLYVTKLYACVCVCDSVCERTVYSRVVCATESCM